MIRGETDLTRMLSELEVEQREGSFAYVRFEVRPEDLTMATAIIEEPEGWTLVVPHELAVANGWHIDFEAAWLTLRVHSDLHSVGLTAAVSATLTEAGIPCNVLAGTYHDHLLVPADDAARAIAAVATLRTRHAE